MNSEFIKILRSEIKKNIAELTGIIANIDNEKKRAYEDLAIAIINQFDSGKGIKPLSPSFNSTLHDIDQNHKFNTKIIQAKLDLFNKLDMMTDQELMEEIDRQSQP